MARKSSVAPPPVETKLILFSIFSLDIIAVVSPPPIILIALLLVIVFNTSSVEPPKPFSYLPRGPFQRINFEPETNFFRFSVYCPTPDIDGVQKCNFKDERFVVQYVYNTVNKTEKEIRKFIDSINFHTKLINY